MGQVAEPEGGASQVFEAAVDGFGGAVAGGGPVEEREDVVAACGQGLAESYDLDQAGGNARSDRRDQPGHDLCAFGSTAGAVGGDHGLVDVPGGLDLDMPIITEQFIQASLLSIGQQISAGVQDSSVLVEPMMFTPAGAVQPARL